MGWNRERRQGTISFPSDRETSSSNFGLFGVASGRTVTMTSPNERFCRVAAQRFSATSSCGVYLVTTSYGLGGSGKVAEPHRAIASDASPTDRLTARRTACTSR